MTINEINHRGRGDEFYTRLRDVQNELPNYNLSGRVVYCNCDYPFHSSFCKYFAENYDSIGLAGLFASSTWKGGGCFEFDGKEWRTLYKNSGKFQDNIALMRICDVIVTNPPFSEKQTQQLIKMAIACGKDFISVGSKQLILDNEMLELFKEHKLNAGYKSIGWFETPEDEESNEPTMWWTSFNVPKKELHTGITGATDFLPDGTLFVDTYLHIPDDYYGPMSVPYSFCRHINQNQFEILEIKRQFINGKNKPRMIITRRNGHISEERLNSIVKQCITEVILRKKNH